MKFGGTSVASLDKIKSAAERVASEVSAGHSVIVIVSAMAGKTNELVGGLMRHHHFMMLENMMLLFPLVKM